MLAKIEQLLQEIEGLQAANAEELEALRIKYLSKKGAINDLMADFRNVPADQKKEVGMKVNELKNKAQEKIAALKEAFATQDNGAAEMDLTRTAYPIGLGTRHPLNIVKNEIIDTCYEQGEGCRDRGEYTKALKAFPEALNHYNSVRRARPDWNQKVIARRIADCERECERMKRLLGDAEPDQETMAETGAAALRPASQEVAKEMDHHRSSFHLPHQLGNVSRRLPGVAASEHDAPLSSRRVQGH